MISTAQIKGLTYVLLAGALGFTACQNEEEVAPLQKTEVASTIDLQKSQAIPGSYIVVMNDSKLSGRISSMANYSDRQAAVKELAVATLQNARIADNAIDKVYAGSVLGFSGKLDEAQVENLRRDKRVKYIEQNQAVVLAPGNGKGGSNKGGGKNNGESTQIVPYGVARVGGPVTYTGTNTAWIIDTGIDLDNRDLNVDNTRSVVFVDERTPNDMHGHGTHVAGTIAAIDNDYGVVGIAAGAPVVAVKVLDSYGWGDYATIIAGIDYVAQNGKPGDVANMSLGGSPSQALDDAVIAAASKGIIFTLAAGNSSMDTNDISPARANGQNIYTISAIDELDNFASFSNYGNPPIDFAAPGVDIPSTGPDNYVFNLSGTSMAAPHAAGVFLISAGKADGNAINDPDGNADPIIHQ